MKKLIGLTVVLVVFAFVGITSASPAEMLQSTAYDVLRVASLHVGEPGVGGVTYFNGTIVNVGESTPVTIGDDLRVDGVITRGDGNDTMPVKIADDVVIQGNLTVEGMAYIGASKITSHWLNSDGVQANYVLRVPHDSKVPTDACEVGNVYADVTAGSAGLYLCDDTETWVAL